LRSSALKNPFQILLRHKIRAMHKCISNIIHHYREIRNAYHAELWSTSKDVSHGFLLDEKLRIAVELNCSQDCISSNMFNIVTRLPYERGPIKTVNSGCTLWQKKAYEEGNLKSPSKGMPQELGLKSTSRIAETSSICTSKTRSLPLHIYKVLVKLCDNIIIRLNPLQAKRSKE